MGDRKREQGQRHPYHHLDIFYEDFKDQQTISCHFQAERQGAVNRDKKEEKPLWTASRNNEETTEI